MPVTQRGPLPSRVSANETTIVTEYCAVLGIAATCVQCARYGTQVSNCREMCTGCKSPLRRCISCIEQGFTDESSIAVSGKKYCQFHLRNSPSTIREPIREEPSKIEVATPPDPPAKGEAPESGQGKRRVDVEKLNALVASIPQDDIKRIVRIASRMHTSSALLYTGIALGKDKTELAEYTRVHVNSVPSKLSMMYKHLGISALPQVQGLSTHEKSYAFRMLVKRSYES